MKTLFSRLQTKSEFAPSTHKQPEAKVKAKMLELAPLYADQVKNLNPHPLPKVVPEKIKVTALNGATSSRCQHGSYWTERFGPVYCESCCPGTSLRMIGTQDSPLNWSMPRLMAEKSPDHVYANPASQHGSASQCPKCHCEFHEELSDGKWKCPDCGHVWKGKAVKGESNATTA